MYTRFFTALRSVLNDNSEKLKKLCETPCPLWCKKKKSYIIHHKSNIMENKQIWSKILHVIITILTAIATTFGVTSCMGM